jgi:hypothetical protein
MLAALQVVAFVISVVGAGLVMAVVTVVTVLAPGSLLSSHVTAVRVPNPSAQ